MKVISTVVLVASSSVAVAAAGQPSASRPRFSELPSARLAVPSMSSAPAKVDRTRKAEGFLVPRPRRNPNVDFFMPVTIHPDAASKRAYEQREPKTGDACYAVGDPRVPEKDWPLGFDTYAAIYVESRGPVSPKGFAPIPRFIHPVSLVHSEKLVLDGAPRLEIAQAWVDVRSYGAELIARSVLPLRAVATGPSGVRVYAARDGSSVHFVVKWVQETPALKLPRSAAPAHESEAEPPASPESEDAPAQEPSPTEMVRTALRSAAVSGSDRESGNIECGHARVRLRADNGGSTATVRLTLLLPPHPNDLEEGIAPTLRLRPLNVNLSVTQLKNEREPTYSVSFGWGGREREVRLEEDPAG